MRSPRGCFKCGDTTYFITDYPKRKKLDSSPNKYDYTKQNDYSKGDDKKKYRFRDKKKKKFQKMMSRACAVLSDLDFSSEDPLAQRRMRGRSTRQVSSPAFASWASHHDTSPTPTPMKVMIHLPRVFLCELPNLKMLFASKTSCLGKVFHENKKLNLELESASSEIASL
jgi:hypothetical protein